MLFKKLLTLACVAGILLCGACFFPGGGPPAPPPPPPLIDLQGVHRIEVAVTDASAASHVEPVVLAKAVAVSIDWKTKGSGVSAQAQRRAGAGDAVLQITILSESSAPVSDSHRPGIVRSMIDFSISASLTRRDGRVIWHETDGEYSVPILVKLEDAPGLWKADAFRDEVFYGLSDRLADRMLYAR
jgi:hypothetical protein